MRLYIFLVPNQLARLLWTERLHCSFSVLIARCAAREKPFAQSRHILRATTRNTLV